MYGQTYTINLPLLSLEYRPVIIPAHITHTPCGIEFRFSLEENAYISGKLTVCTDAREVAEIEIGSPELEDMLEVGDWGFPHMRIGPGHADTLNTDPEQPVDDETLDLLRALIYSAIGYAQGHAARITARLPPTAPAIER